MEYIVGKDYKKKGMSLQFIAIKKGAKCSEENGIIFYKNKPICGIHSQDAYEYFARNDDGKGLKRWKLVKDILSTLSKRDDDYQKRWDRIWGIPYLKKFKRKEYEDHWLWSFEFYNAEIKDLEYIQKLITI